ncbi:MAG TPA: response regulator [Chryseosolibacter sp.]|nr:response regulator [Chryseosolibacter sp.]
MRILLIDDDKDDQLLFSEAVRLISPAIECNCATSGEEGMRMLLSYVTAPALVFLDINMPIMDGRETLKQIRKAPTLQALKVIIYSTSNDVTEKESFLSIGVPFITKPTSFNDLVNVIKKPIQEALTLQPSNENSLLYQTHN